MKKELNVELDKAHEFALGEFKKHENPVLVFVFNGNTYLSKIVRSKLKTKLVFEAVVKAIGHKETGTSENPAKEYLFEVESRRFKTVSQKYFTPKEMHSERMFSNKLMGMVSFLEFLGTAEEFREYMLSECCRMQNSENQICITS